MDVLILLLFVSAILVAGALVFFVRGVGSGDFEYGDHLALLPLENEEGEIKPQSTLVPRGTAASLTNLEEETFGS